MMEKLGQDQEFLYEKYVGRRIKNDFLNRFFQIFLILISYIIVAGIIILPIILSFVFLNVWWFTGLILTIPLGMAIYEQFDWIN